MKETNRPPKAAEEIRVEAEKPINRYYLSLSRKFSAARYVSFLLLAVFVVVMFAGFGRNITYDNFSFLLKDLDSVSGEAETAGDFLKTNIGEDEGASFAVYRGELAVVSAGGVVMYNASGTKTMTYEESFNAPACVASDKYLLVYESGGTKYALFNSFTRVHTGETTYGILSADIADDGSFLLVCGAKEYKYAVSLYDKKFTLVANYYKDKYVMDAVLKDDGSAAAILSLDTANGKPYTEVMIAEVGKGEAKMQTTVDGLCPLRAAYMEDGTLSVTCDGAMLFAKADTGEIFRYDAPSGGVLLSASACGQYTAAVYSEQAAIAEARAVLLGKDGAVRTEAHVHGKTVSAAATEKALFVLTGSSVTVVRAEDGKSAAVPLDFEGAILLPYGKDSVLVCGGGAAMSVSLNDAVFQ